MSILIKDIDVKEIKKGAVACLNIDDVVYFVNTDRIIPIPDHGTLIDREELLENSDSWLWWDEWGNTTMAKDALDDAPVVIPAERSEE